jgi:predicted transposase YdaD
MAETRLRFDAVVKDLFQRDLPTLLAQLAGPAEVREFLNVEFSVVEERVADLVLLLSDGSILHLDFQSHNDPEMPYREGIYGLMIGKRYRRRRVRQIVIYMGAARIRMKDALDLGGIQVAYQLVDIRQFDAAALLASGNPGDFALALLAHGGVRKMREILRKANELPEPQRRRVFTQMAILSGLRGASEQLTMEMNSMGVYVEIESNAFLRNIRNSALAEGRNEGRVEGGASIVRRLLQSKFGPLPVWARQRLENATAEQAEQWSDRVLTARTLTEVLGKP